MLFFGPAWFGAACACWLAGAAILYGAALTRREPPPPAKGADHAKR